MWRWHVAFLSSSSSSSTLVSFSTVIFLSPAPFPRTHSNLPGLTSCMAHRTLQTSLAHCHLKPIRVVIRAIMLKSGENSSTKGRAFCPSYSIWLKSTQMNQSAHHALPIISGYIADLLPPGVQVVTNRSPGRPTLSTNWRNGWPGSYHRPKLAAFWWWWCQW